MMHLDIYASIQKLFQMQNPQQNQSNCSPSLQLETVHRRRHSQTAIHSFGGIKINSLLYFFIPLLVFACLYCYHEAVKKKEEPPFPHATITSTACHYSQDIVFRFLMLPAGGFICLVYYIAYKWLSLLKKKSEYPGPLFGSLYYWGQASVLGFYGAIATIDEKGTPPIHGIGAVFFFILLYIIATSITIVMWDLREWDSKIIGRRSINIKVTIALYLFVIAMYFLIGSLLENGNENDEDIYLVTVEWNLTIGGLIWLLSFVYDFKDIHITFKGDAQDTVKYIA